MSNYVIVDGELRHYGVKGMKWGVRRYQNKDGSLKPTGRKRYSDDSTGDTTSKNKTSSLDRSVLAKKLADRDFTATKKMVELDKEHERELQRLEKQFKEPKVWYDKDGRLTKEAADYMDVFEKEYKQYDRKSLKLWHDAQKEESDLRKTLFSADDVKPQLLKARELHKQIDSLYDETAGQGSKAYKDAFKKYVNSLKDPDIIADAEYGFDHYEWEYSKEHKQAVADYERKVSSMQKEYTDLVTDIGKKITEGFGDQKMSNDSWFKNYEEWGRNEVDEIIVFNRLNL